MTDIVHTDPKRIGEVAQKIVVLLSNENSFTRQRAVKAAMLLLGEESAYIEATSGSESSQRVKPTGPDDLAHFFQRSEKMTPAENVLLCAAYHYQIHGQSEFSQNDIRSIARDAGVILPDRLDMNLKRTTQNGKKLFQYLGKGSFKATASAGLFFKEQWNVKPGQNRLS